MAGVGLHDTIKCLFDPELAGGVNVVKGCWRSDTQLAG